MYSLDQVKSEVERLAALLEAPANLLPTFGRSEDFGRPHIEADATGYHYVVVERGRELSRITTLNFDDLLYHIFEAVTFSMAGVFEVAHRIEQQDCRRIIFRRHIELMSVLSPDWAKRASIKQGNVLREYPFDDLAIVRMRYSQELSRQGRSAGDAWEKACVRYPLPKPS
ncbi:MAG TPA: Imm63 family immunity protein [Blastocatellia bacterium]|nr:Imm63 family immunity protein [Blastocatellia bacterium]